MNRLVCSGCKAPLGVSFEKYAKRFKVYCSVICAHEPPITALSDRNDEWQALNMHGRKPVQIAHLYGSPHGLVYKTLDRLLKPLNS